MGLDVSNLDGDHLPIDYTPTNYVPTDSPAEAGDVDDLAAHLAGIDAAVSSAGSGKRKVEMVEVDVTIITNGFFTIASNFEAASLVTLTPVGGPLQVNKSAIGAVAITPDFECLNSNEVHINNNGAGAGLSDAFQVGDVLVVDYASA